MNVVMNKEKLHRMKNITIKLCSLDLENEENLDILSSLQQEQVYLREELTAWMPDLMQDDDSRGIIQDCIELEQCLSKKLVHQREWAQEQIQRIQVGTRSKNAYGGVFHQTEGYFVDKKK